MRGRMGHGVATCSGLVRAAGCGRAMGPVDVHVKAGTAYGSNVATCGSVWACEVCEAKIRARRAADVSHLARWHAGTGGKFQLVTLTIAHERDDDLGVLVDGLTEAWRRVQRSSWWAETRASVPGFVRSLECTFGFAFGFHPHLHVLLLSRADAELVDVDELHRLWRAAVVAELGEAHAPEETVGVDARWITHPEYVAKVAREVTLSSEKSRNQWVLADRGWWDKLNHFAGSMKGHKALQWSRGLRAACGLSGVEPTDLELAAESAGGDRVVTGIPARTWNRALRAGWAVLFLERCEAGVSLQLVA